MPDHRPAVDLIADAERIADEVLFPSALEADAAGVVPTRQLQCLADAGFYGISTYADPTTIRTVLELLSSGCLTTTFVWAQHLGATAAAFTSDGPVRDELADDLASGRKRGGVAFAHMLRSGPPMTTAEPSDAGWVYSGSAPWVTGWGHIDVVLAAARHGDDIVWALLDAKDGDTLKSEATKFSVVDSTQTRVLAYNEHFVPTSRVTKVEKYDEWRSRYRLGLRSNASFALGVARRCCLLVDDPVMTDELDSIRGRLDSTDPSDEATMSSQRAEASLFAVRAATALVANTGGNGVLASSHGQRLLREAMFVLVQGQTPAIKAEMLAQLR
jgi:alkylation response protein AidB-like acyl-CoA dehydrogenase